MASALSFSTLLSVCLCVALLLTMVSSFSFPTAPLVGGTKQDLTIGSALYAQQAVPPPRKKGYVPKWKKKKTLAEVQGPPQDLTQVGLKGNIKVVFKQGNQTKTTMALAGQPLRDVATQAGQFIKYGCGKGECGTCESLVNGQWIRPCSTNLPPLAPGEEYVIQVKESKAKVVSSGRFYSARSIVLGFWNNLLGMVGFVRDRQLAKKNWDERKEFEEMVRQKTLEKKRQRLAARQGLGGGANINGSNNKLSP